MDPPELPPRKELQGPRPTPLKVSKESHKIRKQSVAPPQAQPPIPPPQHRQPLIIYSVSPKVIHTNPDDFMTLVQRLTGPSSPSSSFASISGAAAATTTSTNGPPVSPAARLATIEKTRQSAANEKPKTGDFDIMDQLDIETNFDRTGSLPGILSPIPSSLPPIPPNFFSPSTDPDSLCFGHELSPIFNGYKNYIEGSPTFLSSAPIPSPTLCFDLFNQFVDF